MRSLLSCVLLLAVACAGIAPEEDVPCVTGEVARCLCPDAVASARLCEDSAWGRCLCEDTPPDAAVRLVPDDAGGLWHPAAPDLGVISDAAPPSVAPVDGGMSDMEIPDAEIPDMEIPDADWPEPPAGGSGPPVFEGDCAPFAIFLVPEPGEALAGTLSWWPAQPGARAYAERVRPEGGRYEVPGDFCAVTVEDVDHLSRAASWAEGLLYSRQPLCRLAGGGFGADTSGRACVD